MAVVSATASAEKAAPERDDRAAKRYEQLATERQPYLDRARECARLTIPSIMPEEGHTGANRLYKPWSSVGADCVNNLAAKLLLALFPPGTPFFRLAADPFILEDLMAATGGQEDVEGELEKAFGKIERTVSDHMESTGARKVHFETILHLIVTGNGLQHVNNEGKIKFFPLDRYVVARDLDDNVLEIIVKETVARVALPDKIREIVDRHNAPTAETVQRNIDVYTWVRREKNQWRVHQEVCGEVVPGSEGSYPLDRPAFIPLRWRRISGEAYGRGRCEDYLGDLDTLDGGTKAIRQFAAVASKIVALVDESGVTDKNDLADAESGAILDGRAADVTFLMVEKDRDFAVAKSVLDEARVRLERGFLMASSIQRQAERVTAEEIRLMAGELEQGLGGTYSVLGEEWQRPLVARLLHVLSRGNAPRIPELPRGTANPQIVTGLDGLGRNSDMMRLDALIAGVAQQFGPEEVRKWVNVGAYMQRRAAALGIDVDGLVRSQEEVQQQDQQAQMMQMAESLGGPAIKAVSDNVIAARQQQQGGMTE